MPTTEPPAAASYLARVDDVMRRVAAAREVARVHDTEPEWWQPLYELAASLDEEKLVYYVAGLTRLVQAGDTSLADELAVACRILHRIYETRHRVRVYPAIRGACPRLDREFPETAREPAQYRVAKFVLKQCDQFATATFEQITGWFLHGGIKLNDRIATGSMRILPDDPTMDPGTRVVLYGTLNAGPAPLLYEPAGSPNWEKRITRLLDRVVRHEPFPWERGGWNGD